MGPNILFVEDNHHKRGKVIAFLKDRNPSCNITEAHSFTSGTQKILENEYDVVLLDMSLPTYDKSKNEPGGRFRTFGGKEIARKVRRRNKQSKIIFITQYASFSDNGRSQTLDEIRNELSSDNDENYIGTVFYDSSQSAWKEKLIAILEGLKCGF